MSREIKFRAWSKKTKKMYKVIHLHLASYDGVWVTCERNCPFEQKTVHYDIQPRECIVMQFPGLKDIHGVDIYEGDIIAYSHKKKEGDKIVTIVKEKGHEVIYKNGCFFLDNEPLGYEWEEDKFVECDTQKWATVIGNVHENPELLTK